MLLANEMKMTGHISLKKEFTLRSGIALIVGQIIGSGIFVTPTSILQYAGSFGASVIFWIFGAVVSIAGGLCYIELGLLVNKGGGESGYLLEAYSLKNRNRWSNLVGSMLSFLFVWSGVFIIRPASMAIQSLSCAKYLTKPFYDGEKVPEYLVKAIALILTSIVTLINAFSVKLTTRVITVLSSSKVITVVFVAAIGVIFTITRGTYPEVFKHPFQTIDGHVNTLSSIALAMYRVLWSYNGWNCMNYALEETIDIKRTLPLSILIGISVVSFSYILINISLFATLTYEQILKADAIILPFGEATLGNFGVIIIPFLVSLCNFSSMAAVLYAGSRITFSAARDGFLPECISGIHRKYRTPLPAIIFCMGSVLLMVVGISELIEGCVASIFLFYLLVIIGLIIMRFTHHEEPRLYKPWFIFPVAIFMVLVFASLVFLPLLLQPGPSIIAFSVILLGVPIYLFFVMEKPWRLRPYVLDKISGQFTHVVNSVLNTDSSRIQV